MPSRGRAQLNVVPVGRNLGRLVPTEHEEKFSDEYKHGLTVPKNPQTPPLVQQGKEYSTPLTSRSFAHTAHL